MNADARLSVLLAHLAPNQQPAFLQPGSRDESRWVIPFSGTLVIVGGICLDIQAQPSDVDVQRGTSVPGKVRQVPGGVGRNIAEALSGLVPVDRPAPIFVSLVGDDPPGNFLTTSLRRLRLDLFRLMTCPGVPTPCVSAVLERGGEVAACVADVSSVEQLLTPERLQECKQQIQQACLVLAEGNLSVDALSYVSRTASLAGVPVFLEPVSVPKAKRLVPSLPYATFVTPNAAELMSMADEVRTGAGLPLLPRPLLPADPGQGRGGGAGAGDLEPAALVSELLRQLAAFAEVVLLRGTSCVVLTLGALGAALITLCDDETAAAAAAPRSTLEPLDASSSIDPSCNLSSPSSSRSDLHRGTWSSPAGSGTKGVRSSTPIASLNSCTAAVANPSAAALSASRPGICDPSVLPPPGSSSLGAIHHPAVSVPDGQGGHCLAAPRLSAAPEAQQALQPYRPPPPPPSQQKQQQQQPATHWHHGAVLVAHLRALPAEVVSVNGAGDTLVAGMVAALLQQQEPVQALAHGMAAAKRAVESHNNVPDLNFAALRSDADKILATLRRHVFPRVLAPP